MDAFLIAAYTIEEHRLHAERTFKSAADADACKHPKVNLARFCFPRESRAWNLVEKYIESFQRLRKLSCAGQFLRARTAALEVHCFSSDSRNAIALL